MILIISKEFDDTTNQVARWLSYYKSNYYLLYYSDIVRQNFYFDVNSNIIQVNNNIIDTKKVNVVWFRKWAINFPEIKFIDITNSVKLNNLLKTENEYITQFLFNSFKSAFWIDNPFNNYINKIGQYRIAKAVGFNVPNTIVTNNKKPQQK